MPVFMQKLGAQARVFDVGAANKSRVCTRGDAVNVHAPKASRIQRAGTPRKWIIAGLR